MAPGTDEGALMIAIFHGPLQITNPNGQIEAIVGIHELFAIAEANGRRRRICRPCRSIRSRLLRPS